MARSGAACLERRDPDAPLAANVLGLQVGQEEVFHALRKLDGGHKEGTLEHVNWWTKPDPLGAHATSRSVISVTVSIRSSGEQLTVPVETSATCLELASLISERTGVSSNEIGFVSKQGCSWRRMYLSDQVRPRLFVTGVESFSRMRHRYEHPKAVVGAGHLGLKTAMVLLKKGDTDFVVFDRMSRVGGTSWMYQANTTSKLQTEYGLYHLEFDEDNPVPTMFSSPWPSRNKLLEHFQHVCEEYGILPYIRFRTNVKDLNLIDASGGILKTFSVDRWDKVAKYRLALESVGEGQLHRGRFVPELKPQDAETFDACGVMLYPGNLTLPREEVYRGEELFGGILGYGMFDEVDYEAVRGKNAVIVGHGAFAVENVRTCCEYGANKCYIVCRRKNIACPRVTSWLTNRSLNPLTAPSFLNFMQPMYDLIGWDVWSYYAVHANEKRTTCMITQKARFGIGDIYFLSIYMGKLEVVVEPKGIRKLGRHKVYLESGRKLEDVQVFLKLLGFVGEPGNDRLMKIKQLVGFWADADPRRYVVAEPVSVMATSMGYTSLSPAALMWARMGVYFFHHPQDFASGVAARGVLPRHEADFSDESTPRPAYVVDARHGTSTALVVALHTPGLARDQRNDDAVKAVKHRLCHPVEKFIAAAKEDWDHYARSFLAEGFGVDRPYPEYPYTAESVRAMIRQHMEETMEQMLLCDSEDLRLAGGQGRP